MDAVAHVEVCRLCANFYVTGAEVDFVHLFEPIAGLEEQLQFLHDQAQAWQLNITPNDGLPQRICANCFTQFCNIQAFQQQCGLAQQKLFQSYVGVGLTAGASGGSKPIAALSQQGGSGNSANTHALLGEPMVETPVTSAELIASLDGLQPPTTTSADVIASLDGLQLPASVAETLSLLTQELTTIQNNSALDTSGIAITTHATMDTKTEETNVLQFSAASSMQNFYTGQPAPITTVAAAKPTVTLVTNVSTKSAKNESMRDEKTEIDLEDMLQGSIIPKNANANIQQQKGNEEEMSKGQVYEVQLYEEQECDETLQPSTSSMDDFDDEDMDCNSISDPEESNELEDIEQDIDAGSQTRISRNPFACQYCYCPTTGSVDHLIFDSSEALSQHFFDVHDPNLPYTCPYCPQKYSSAKQRDYHVRLMHASASKTDQCEYCKKILRSTKQAHEFNCQFVGDWRCATCDQYFRQVPLSRFRTHQRHHATRKQYKCRDCGRQFVRRANLQAHERMHRPRSNYSIGCDQCQMVFTNDYEMRRHKYQAHNGDLPVRCEYCMKGFVSMAFLSRHTQHFHPDRLQGRNFHAATCTNCGCTFSSLHKLRAHIQRPRDENGRCMEIVRELAPIQDRSRPLRRPRLFNCPHCNKRFSTQATLEKHINTHDPPTINCNECAVDFENTAELKRHITEVHARPRCLKCDQCDKRFFYMRELQQHVKLHAQQIETHLRAKHAFKLATEEANNNNKTNSQQTGPIEIQRGMKTTNMPISRMVPDQETEDSLAVASILNNNLPENNNDDIMVSFNNDSGEKVRVELVQQQTPLVNQIVLQEQTSNNFQQLIPNAGVNNMEQENLLLSTLLDADHEIIVT